MTPPTAFTLEPRYRVDLYDVRELDRDVVPAGSVFGFKTAIRALEYAAGVMGHSEPVRTIGRGTAACMNSWWIAAGEPPLKGFMVSRYNGDQTSRVHVASGKLRETR